MTLAATAIALIVAVTLGYAFLCWVSPFAACRACDGTGNREPFSLLRALLGRPEPRRKRRRIRTKCRRCRGTGARLRIGRRIHNNSRRLRHDATR
ncbi:hypothetical protein GCM10023205_52570 [Yinghuangia aomiensis]|uniref:Secreted protein n=1 Tax=Yinghuangia aomiensis TaxID=676205 RepID=A0ABP9HTW5_9ACTN